MSRFFKLYIIILLFTFPSALFTQIKAPVVQDIPDVEFNAAETSERYKAAVTLYGKGIVNGEILINTGASINPSGDKGRIYPLRDVSRITIIKWSGQRKGTGSVFYPGSYEIILKDRTRIIHDGNIGFLNKIRFVRGEGGELSLYTYFYDYFRKGKWVNTGTAGEKTLPSNPAAGTTYIIELK